MYRSHKIRSNSLQLDNQTTDLVLALAQQLLLAEVVDAQVSPDPDKYPALERHDRRGNVVHLRAVNKLEFLSILCQLVDVDEAGGTGPRVEHQLLDGADEDELIVATVRKLHQRNTAAKHKISIVYNSKRTVISIMIWSWSHVFGFQFIPTFISSLQNSISNHTWQTDKISIVHGRRCWSSSFTLRTMTS